MMTRAHQAAVSAAETTADACRAGDDRPHRQAKITTLARARQRRPGSGPGRRQHRPHDATTVAAWTWRGHDVRVTVGRPLRRFIIGIIFLQMVKVGPDGARARAPPSNWLVDTCRAGATWARRCATTSASKTRAAVRLVRRSPSWDSSTEVGPI